MKHFNRWFLANGKCTSFILPGLPFMFITSLYQFINDVKLLTSHSRRIINNHASIYCNKSLLHWLTNRLTDWHGKLEFENVTYFNLTSHIFPLLLPNLSVTFLIPQLRTGSFHPHKPFVNLPPFQVRHSSHQSPHSKTTKTTQTTKKPIQQQPTTQISFLNTKVLHATTSTNTQSR